MTVKYPAGSMARYRAREKKLKKSITSHALGIKPEHEIQDEIRYMLALNGHDVYRANVGLMKTADGKRGMSTGLPAGFPDLFGSRKGDGKIFYIEVKNKRGKRRPKQIEFAVDHASKPVIYGVARSAEEALNIVENGINDPVDHMHPKDIE